MHPSYTDILDTMTALMRESHAETKAHGEGPSSRCADEIDPVTEMCRCEARPLWWDENGTPRFQPHHPDLCADIYADEVALLKIACQRCGREFLVQMSQGPHAIVQLMAMSSTHGVIPQLLDEVLKLATELDAYGRQHTRPDIWHTDSLIAERARIVGRIAAISVEFGEQRKLRPQTLADQVTAGVIHYGDPPHVDCCAAGATMNCNDLAVVEFWRRGRAPSGPVTLDEAMDAMGWSRVPELECELPDGKGRPIVARYQKSYRRQIEEES